MAAYIIKWTSGIHKIYVTTDNNIIKPSMYVAETHGAYGYYWLHIIVLKLVQIAAAKFNDFRQIET